MSRIRISIAAAVASLAALGTAVVPATSASAASFSCSTYSGTFNSYGARGVDWMYGPDECFGVAPSGTIWHSWAGSGGWKEMPGNGRALYILDFFENSEGKAVKVVTETGNAYCNYDDYATNTWGGWYGTTTDNC
ncbi:hypothetical protein GCM10009612_21910 [Streptomyces beijiangensis]